MTSKRAWTTVSKELSGILFGKSTTDSPVITKAFPDTLDSPKNNLKFGSDNSVNNIFKHDNKSEQSL